MTLSYHILLIWSEMICR